MFTGIVQTVGRVLSAEKRSSSLSVRIQTQMKQLELGESIAVNGVCLTVAESAGFEKSENDVASFFISSETLSRTNLHTLADGQAVNLERALTASATLSGHIVQGHVDGLAELLEVRPVQDTNGGETAYEVHFQIPRSLSRYCVEKGSIALNGVSLTINSIVDSEAGSKLGFMLIPHTWKHTNLSSLRPGDRVNVEVDVLAKYVERLCQPHLQN